MNENSAFVKPSGQVRHSVAAWEEKTHRQGEVFYSLNGSYFLTAGKDRLYYHSNQTYPFTMRALTIKNLYEKRHETFEFTGHWANIFGTPTTTGCWLIYGQDKNGKTRAALRLAKYLSNFTRVLYVSAEEGDDKSFIDTVKWADITLSDRIQVLIYESIEELSSRLKKRKAPGVVFLDNLTIYADELNGSLLKNLIKDHPRTLFIFMAHEDRKEPYTAAGKMAKKLAKIILHIVGLQCTVSGRCPGGAFPIDNDLASLYHGQPNSN
jgi:hypothetical protein